jgi:hypothetical protein
VRELSTRVGELAAKYHDEQAHAGRLFRFVLGAYPAITKTEEEVSLCPPSPNKDLNA